MATTWAQELGLELRPVSSDDVTGPVSLSLTSRREAWTTLLDVFKCFLNPIRPQWFSPGELELALFYATWLHWVALGRLLLRSAGRRIRKLCRREGFVLHRLDILKPGVMRSENVPNDVRVLLAHADRVGVRDSMASPFRVTASVGLSHFSVAEGGAPPLTRKHP